MGIREKQAKSKQNCAVLWYDRPAADWNEALPVGNGRIGGMVFGEVGCEHIQVNEETIWYGGPMDRNNPSAREKLPVIQGLIREGRIREAERLCKQALGGTPCGMRIYQTLGDIFIDYCFDGNMTAGNVEGYERGLNVENAVSYVSFRHGGTEYERELFMSAPDDVCVMHLTAKGREKLNLEIMQSRHHIYEYVGKTSADSIVLGGNLGRDGLDYAMMCKAVSPDGKVEVIGESLTVSDATEAYVYWSAATTYRIKVEKPADVADEGRIKREALEQALRGKLDAAAQKSYDALLEDHCKDYRHYYNQVSLTLSADSVDSVGVAAQPTDRCLEAVLRGETDVSLEQLYFNFGRYLLISCSRPGMLPATLQGLWNKDMEAPWDAKYTININTEMNYWPAEACGLGDCHLPLFDLLKTMYPNGKKTAQVMYGCRGFVAHHNTDIWGDTAPQDLWIPGSFWVMGGAWLCTHIWTHYEYTGDVDFLREMFPIMRDAAQFFLDFCIEYEIAGTTCLCTCPSVSPENTFILPNGEEGANSVGVTMDNQILRDLFTQCNEAAKVLGVSDDLDRQIREACGRLIPTRIGSDGRILEWCEEYREKEPGHRHISHLYGLHPSGQITKDGTPELARAAELTLQKRLESGGGHTGWSRAWIMNHYAKLWDGEKAHENLRQLLIRSTLPNLFDNHPPFQIDGNFGSIAAMTEMLVQSNAERIVLLPALPKAWPSGKITGVRVRGNARMDIEWKEGRLEKAQICSGRDGMRRFVYDGCTLELALRKNEWIAIEFPVK